MKLYLLLSLAFVWEAIADASPLSVAPEPIIEIVVPIPDKTESPPKKVCRKKQKEQGEYLAPSLDELRPRWGYPMKDSKYSPIEILSPYDSSNVEKGKEAYDKGYLNYFHSSASMDQRYIDEVVRPSTSDRAKLTTGKPIKLEVPHTLMGDYKKWKNSNNPSEGKVFPRWIDLSNVENGSKNVIDNVRQSPSPSDKKDQREFDYDEMRREYEKRFSSEKLMIEVSNSHRY